MLLRYGDEASRRRGDGSATNSVENTGTPIGEVNGLRAFYAATRTARDQPNQMLERMSTSQRWAFRGILKSSW